MAMQHINTNDLNGTKYIVKWGDTLSGISTATGISVAKIAYDNHIQNINLIYAGQTLILNKDGDVPQNFHPQGDPNQVVISKTTINNGPKNVKFAVSPKVSVNNTYQTNNNNTTNNSNTTNDNNDASATSSHSTKKHGSATSSSTTHSSIDTDTLADQLNSAAGKNDDDISYSTYSTDDSDELKPVDLGNDADEINALVQKGTKKSIKKAEILIMSHLDDDTDDAYVNYQDGKFSVYTKKKSAKDSSSSDDHDSSSQSDNNDSQVQDTNDNHDADEDDD